MQQLINVLDGIGSTLQLLVRSLSYTATLWRQRQRFIEQCYLIGYTTLYLMALLPVVFFLCWFFARTLDFVPPMK